MSALRKTEGRSQLAGGAGDYSSMMIDGDSEGAKASHPRIGERVAAIIRHTVSMVLCAPRQRRDTRLAPGQRGFGRRGLIDAPAALDFETIAAARLPQERGLVALMRRVAADSPHSFLGQPKKANWIIGLWFVLFVGVYHADLTDMHRLRERLMYGSLHGPTLDRLSQVDFGHKLEAPDASSCQAVAAGFDSERCAAALRGGETAANVAQKAAAEDHWLAAQVAQHQCFATVPLSAPGAPDLGQPAWPVDRQETNASASLFVGMVHGAGEVFAQRRTSDLDGALAVYMGAQREAMTLLAVYYGPAGVALGRNALETPENQSARAALAGRLKDTGYIRSLSQVDLAEYRLMAEQPQDFAPCRIKLGHDLRWEAGAEPGWNGGASALKQLALPAG